ncbi:methionine adenosyltransferase [Spiroplasma endosymbiont of Amphibalanus improvisus]|uniref:methionine adenosyltransferase n=1 Tax=Spiroplasma endosymbiont of Amphibalanus improvisus TaxID=3066327 RepID=UPI00313BCED7
MSKILFTSESVSEGHPDKICDQISDAILDECLKLDPKSRVACETFICNQTVVLGGEITTKAKLDYVQIVRNILKEIGYDNSEWGIDYRDCQIINLINHQSPDIALGVDHNGAGDQGIVYGYAVNKNDRYMPNAIVMAHDLVSLASKLRKENHFLYARPDMKSQVTLDTTDPKFQRIDTILMSIQHSENYDANEFFTFIKNNIIMPIAKKYNMNTDFKILINPTGKFSIGGPKADTGLTGRKIIVDTYGGSARHGGGAFSGKDATKTDRSAAYMCRYAMKNLVASGVVADECEIQVSYAIGMEKPISVYIDTKGTEKIPKDQIYDIINKFFDFSPKQIIKTLGLKKPIFKQTAVYGHFGKDEKQQQLPWENLDMVEAIKKYVSNLK